MILKAKEIQAEGFVPSHKVYDGGLAYARLYIKPDSVKAYTLYHIFESSKVVIQVGMAEILIEKEVHNKEELKNILKSIGFYETK